MTKTPLNQKILRAIGLVAVSAQIYKWFVDDLDLSINQFIVTCVFTTLAIKPRVLTQITSLLFNKLKTKTNA